MTTPSTAAAELILCVPGPWADRSEFLRRIVTLEPMGRTMFAGMVLADMEWQDHVGLDFADADPRMAEAFAFAGQGRIDAGVLAEIAAHRSVAYLHFPLDLPGQRERIQHFTEILQRAGGLAIKVESSGAAHAWPRWFERLAGTPFDLYGLGVVLVGGENCYYSCGMHLFGLPDCEVPQALLPIEEAAELMNRFNFWQIIGSPVLASGHTFSVAAEATRYRLEQVPDERHAADALFHNPHGLWQFSPAALDG